MILTCYEVLFNYKSVIEYAFYRISQNIRNSTGTSGTRLRQLLKPVGSANGTTIN
jgi:hypothetical protein